MFTKIWKAEYQGNQIRIENSWFSERLIVNGVLQDEQIGLGIRSRLYGKVMTEDGRSVQVKVSLGARLLVECRLFVDDGLIRFTHA